MPIFFFVLLSYNIYILSNYLSTLPPTLSIYLSIAFHWQRSTSFHFVSAVMVCLMSISLMIFLCIYIHAYIHPSPFILHLVGCVEIHVYYTNKCVFVCVCVCVCLTHPTSSLKEKLKSVRVRVWGNVTAMSIIRGCVCVCVCVCECECVLTENLGYILCETLFHSVKSQ